MPLVFRGVNLRLGGEVEFLSHISQRTAGRGTTSPSQNPGLKLSPWVFPLNHLTPRYTAGGDGDARNDRTGKIAWGRRCTRIQELLV